MTIENEILLNQYGQDLISLKELMSSHYDKISTEDKRIYLNDILNLIIQSKPVIEDVPHAIRMAGLKDTYTPCVLLKKGITYASMSKIINLPDDELEKAVVLFLNLFKIAYRRRFSQETDTTHKWWYKDLSGSVEEIKKSLSGCQGF